MVVPKAGAAGSLSGLNMDADKNCAGKTFSNLNLGDDATLQGAPVDPASQLPSLLNRILRIQDGAASPNDLEIHQVWIPFFRSAGFTQTNLNNLLLGGFYVDK
ncbi:MAG: hypothetical protein PHP59_10225, partial [Methanofollis sp.]|uniref:hypothetical protein n=1 Tax=Methanofollis sp. TaxID=2052835 RepID=UPI002637DA3B